MAEGDNLPDEKLEIIIGQFKSLFHEHGRHNYTAISTYVTALEQKDDNNISIIEKNLDNILKKIKNGWHCENVTYVNTSSCEEDCCVGVDCSENKKQKNLYRNIEKFQDHLELEQARYVNYNAVKIDKQLVQMESIREVVESKVKEVVAFIDTMLKNTEKNISAIYPVIVSVLAIFAAITLAFMGDGNVIVATFSNLPEVDLSRTIAIAMINGIIIFNTIAMLMYLVGRITERPVTAKCVSDYCVNCNDRKRKEDGKKTGACNAFKRFRKRNGLIFWMNILFFSVLGIDGVIRYLILNNLWIF
ncbi:MAG: hypothetical protein LBN36_07720 [Clostridiales Family XIII bacterium]|nr:hypothetical protein [Clostridiales Family XIII bacterium]